MLCERYKTALIEAAAGAALTEDAKRHVDDCNGCRAEFNQQQRLSTAISAGLIARSNAALPAHYEQRLGVRIQAESASGKRKLWLEPRWVFATIFAAILCAVLLQQRKAGEMGRIQNDELPETATVRKTNDIPHQQALQTAPRTHLTARNQVHPVESQEVLVGAEENAALASYMKALNEREVQSAMSAELEHRTEMVPERVERVEIPGLKVTPLSDLGAEDSTDSEQGRSR